MKLAKLSLAAILAAGAFSVANATSLEDAIKGVDLSGFVRLRFYNNDRDEKNGPDNNRWRGSSIFKFTVPVSDTIKFHYNVTAEQSSRSNGNQYYSSGLTSTKSGVSGSGLENKHIYLAYSDAGLNVIAGRIPVVTSATAAGYGEPYGSGIVATYGFGNGLTLAAGWIDDIQGVNINEVKISGVTHDFGGADIAAVAALYNSNMISLQAWAYKITNILKNDFTVSAAIKPIDGLTIKGDFATSKGEETGAKNHKFWNVSASYAADGFTIMGGYASTNKNEGAIVLTADAALGNVTGAQYYNIANATDTDAYYAKLGFSVDAQTSVYATYHNIDAKDNAKDESEYVVGAGYKYNKKLNLNAYYSVRDFDKSDSSDNNQLRFEAKYSF